MDPFKTLKLGDKYPKKDLSDLLEQILVFTITVSFNQLNQYNYTKQKRILTEPVISSMKLITI